MRRLCSVREKLRPAPCGLKPSPLAAEGRFRPDLMARLNMWSFRLPALRDRREDFEANLIFELARAERELGEQVGFNSDARDLYLRFARNPATLWTGNVRDFGSSIRRLCTLAPRARITRSMVEEEIVGLNETWRSADVDDDHRLLADVLGTRAADIDPFDRVQLAEVIRTCQRSSSLSDAGRRLFSVSRMERKSTNDADRLCKYLARFDIDWSTLVD